MNFHFPVNREHTNANNEYYRDARRLLISSGIFSALLLVGAVLVLIVFDRTPFVIGSAVVLFALAALYVGVTFQVRRAIKDPQELYDESPLVPAMIARVDERTMVLMTLVDMRKNPSDGEPVPALATRTVTTISGVPRRVGAKVPAVAVAGTHKSRTEFYDEITPVPLAWSTPDKAVIAQAQRNIPVNDWNVLERNIDRVEEVHATKRNLLPLN